MVLFDCGEATQKQMMYAQISPMKIDDIYITHLHGDHILGLPGLIQSLAFRGRTRPLNIYGPEGIDELLEHIKKLGSSAINYEIITHSITDDDSVLYEQDDFVVKARKMKHTVTNYAYMIEEIRQPKFLKAKALELNIPPGPLFGQLQAGCEIELDGVIIKPEQVLGPPRKGVKMVFSGDTIPQESMVEFARDVDLLIHEATFSKKYADKAEENGHTIAEDAARIAKDANVEQLILTHISNRYTDSNELLNEAKEIFENTVYAHDFMTVIIENKKAVQIINNE
jgi:ribonuclease Z